MKINGYKLWIFQTNLQRPMQLGVMPPYKQITSNSIEEAENNMENIKPTIEGVNKVIDAITKTIKNMEKENKLREAAIQYVKSNYNPRLSSKENNEEAIEDFIEGAKSEAARLYHENDSVELEELRVKFNKAMVSGELQGRPSMSDIFNWFAPHLHQKAEQNDAWISVEDRLPEKEKFVLVAWHVYSISEHNPEPISVRVLVDKNGFRIGAVTHWQPLPQPPNQLKK